MQPVAGEQAGPPIVGGGHSLSLAGIPEPRPVGVCPKFLGPSPPQERCLWPEVS